MNIYEARIRLTYCEEFTEAYISLIKNQFETACKELESKYGTEAAAEVREHQEEYIEYALTSAIRKASKKF